MAKKKKVTPCVLVNKGIFLGPAGNISPCCLSTYSFGNIKETSLEKAFVSKQAKLFRKNYYRGQLDKDCDNCITNKINHRVFSNQKYINNNSIFLEHAELNLSNTCNLQCIMCGPMSAHKWAKALGETHWNFNLNKEQCIAVAQTLKNVKTIVLKGGEPFYHGYIDNFFEELLKINPSVNINILSNGTNWKDNTLDILNKFPNKPSISISLEAIGDLYKYIRGGEYSFEDVLSNIDKAKSKGIITNFLQFASTISFWNMDVWIEQHHKLIQVMNNELKIPDIDISIDYVRHPISSSIYLKKVNHRTKIFNNIQNNKLFRTKGKLSSAFLLPKEDKIDHMANIQKHNKFRNLDIETINPYILDNLTD